MKASAAVALAVAISLPALCAGAQAAGQSAGPAPATTPSGPMRPWGPDLSAVVSHEVTVTLSNGVTRTDRWRDRLLRSGSTLWRERVLPGTADAAATTHFHGPGDKRPGSHGHGPTSPPQREGAPGGHGHEHFDPARTAQWIDVSNPADISLRLVDREHSVVIDVPRSEFSSVGFDGDVASIAAVVSPSVIEGMQPERGTGANAAGRWLSMERGGRRLRVLWSDALRIALRVESSSLDGLSRSTIRTEVDRSRSAVRAPWQHLGTFEQRRYSDYMD